MCRTVYIYMIYMEWNNIDSLTKLYDGNVVEGNIHEYQCPFLLVFATCSSTDCFDFAYPFSYQL